MESRDQRLLRRADEPRADEVAWFASGDPPTGLQQGAARRLGLLGSSPPVRSSPYAVECVAYWLHRATAGSEVTQETGR